MSTTIDERVVEMRFDNKQFEANVQTSIGTLGRLKHSLNLDGAAKGLENVDKAAKKVDVSKLSDSLGTVQAKFSALEVMGVTALVNLTNSAVNAGKRIAAALTIEPVTTGFNEYELKMDSIQTIMAGTGESLERVNEKLDELNKYSDRTIYSFSDMTSNIGKFTNAGVKLDDAVAAIQGVANVAAVSGANANEASRAMYNFGQALSSGCVRLIDWKSIENANMATVEFKQELIDTAVAMGTLVKAGDQYKSTTTDLNGKVSDTFDATRMFNDSLSSQWMTTEVLTETLRRYADETTEVGKKAYAAATEVKTLTQMWDVLKETAQSGWAETWQTIVGDFNQAKQLFTGLQATFGGMIDAMSESRNNLLKAALNSIDLGGLGGREKLINILLNSLEGILDVLGAVGKAWDNIFPPMTADKLYGAIEALERISQGFIMSEETADKLQRTFQGLFAIIDIFTTLTGGALKAAIQAVCSLLGMADVDILELTANLGDGLVALRDWIKEHNLLAKGIEAGGKALISFVSTLKEWFQAFKSMPQVQDAMTKLSAAFGETGVKLNDFLVEGGKRFQEFWQRVSQLDGLTLDNAITALKDFRDNVLSYFAGNFGGVFSGLTGALGDLGAEAGKAFDILTGAAEKAGGKAKSALDVIAGGFVTMKDKLFETAVEIRNKLAGKLGFGEIFAIGIGTSIAVFAMKVAQSLRAIETLIESIASPLEGLGNLLKSSSKAIDAFAMGMKSEALLNVAKALLVMVGALAALTLLDQDKLLGATLTIAALSAVLAGLSLAVSKMGDMQKLLSMSATLAAVGASLLMMSGALKTISEMEGNVLGSLAALSALAAGLVVVCKVLGSNEMKFSKGALSMVAFAAAVGLLARSMKQLDGLELQNTGRTITILVGAITGLSLVAAASKNVSFGGAATLLAAVTSLKLLVGSFKSLAKMDMGEIRQGISALVPIFTMFGAVMAASKLAGENAGKAGAAIMMMSASLILIVGALKIMEGIDPSALTRVTNSVSQLMLVFAAITALSHFAGQNAAKAGAMLLLMSGAITILSAVMVMLAHLDPAGLDQALGAIVKLELVFGAMVALSHFAGESKQVQATIITMTACVAGLAAITAAFTMIEPDKLQNATIAISALMAAFGLMVAATGVAKSASAAILLMAGVVAELAVILGVLTGLNVQPSIETAGALSLLMTAMSASLVILSKASPISMQAVGAAALMGAVVAELAAVLGVMSALHVEPSIETAGALSILLVSMSAALAILSAVGTTGPAAFVGMGALATLIAGMGGIMAAISALTADNPTVEDDLDRAIMVLEKVGTGLGSVIGGIIGGAIGSMSEALPIIGTNLSEFMSNAKPFFEQAKGIDESSMNGVKALAETLLILTGTNLAESLTSWFTGGTNISAFTDQLKELGPGLMEFSASVKGINGSDVETAANAAKVLAEFARSVPNEGGLLAKLVGDNSLTVFAEELAEFGPALMEYANSVKGLPADVVENSASAAKALAEMANKLPNSGGVLAEWIGDNTLTAFAEELCNFGPALMKYAGSVDGLPKGVVEASASAASAMAAFANKLPNSGGILAEWIGDNTLTMFASELDKFGPALMGYASSVANLPSGVVEKSAAAAGALSEIANGLPSVSKFDEWFGGKQTLEGFGKQMASFGEQINIFANSMPDVNPERMQAVFASLQQYVNLAGTIQNTSSTQSLSEFAKALKDLANVGITSFQEAFTSGTTPASVVIDAMNTAKQELDKYQAKFKVSGKDIGQNAVDGVKEKVSGFKSAGQDAAQGFINGIKAKQGDATTAGRNLGLAALNAARKALDSHSPSVAFMELGHDTVSGFVGGVKEKAGDAVSAVSGTMSKVVEAGKNGLASLRESLTGAVGDLTTPLTESLESVTEGINTTTVAQTSSMKTQSAATKSGYSEMKKETDSYYQNKMDWIEEEKYYNRLSLQEELAVYEELLTHYREGSEERKKIDREIYRLHKELVADAYQSELDWIEEEKYYNRLSLAEELAKYEEMQQKYEEGSEYRKKIDREVYRLHKELAKESYQASIDWIEEEKYYDRMTTAEEIAAYERVKNAHLDDAEIIKECDRKLYSLRKQLAQEAAQAEINAYQSVRTAIDDLKFYDNLNLSEELEALKRLQGMNIGSDDNKKQLAKDIYSLEKQISEIRQQFADDSVRIQEEAAAKRLQLEQEYADKVAAIQAEAANAGHEAYQAAMTWIEDEKFYDRLNLSEELALLRQLQSMGTGSEADQKALAKSIYSLEKQINQYRQQFADDSVKIEEDAAAKRLKLEEEYANKVESIMAKAATAGHEAYQAAMTWIDDEKFYDRLNLSEELELMKELQRLGIGSDDDKKNLDKKIYSLEKQLNQYRKQYADEVAKAEAEADEKRLKLEKDYADNVAKIEEKAAEKRKNREEQYYKDVQKIQEDAAKEREKLEEELADKIASINDKLTSDIDAANQKYEDAVKSRTDALYKAYGLFDEVTAKEAVSSATLMKNLQDQVNEFGDWQDQLDKLSMRGVDDELIGELQEMGPSAIAQIKALNSMTDDELEKYTSLWAIRHAQAREQALKELEGMKQATADQIEELRNAAAAELDEYKALWDERMAEVSANAAAELDALQKQFELDMDEINSDTAKELEDLRAEWQLKMDEVNEAVAEKLDQLKTEFDEKVGSITADTKSKIEAMAGEVNRVIDEINDNTAKELADYEAAWRESMDAVDREAAEKLAALQKNFDEKVGAISADTQSKISSMAQVVNSKIAEIQSQAAAKLAEYQASWQESMAAVDRDAEEQLEALQKTFDEKLGALTSDSEAKISAMVEEAIRILKEGEWEETGEEIIEETTDGVDEKSPDFVESVETMMEDALDAAKSTIDSGDWEDVGSMAGEGLAQGLWSKYDSVVEAAQALSAAAAQAARAALDEHSPSKVFENIGGFGGLGFVRGLQLYASKAEGAAEQLTNAATRGISDAIAHAADLVESGQAAQPVIRPVLDLSDVMSGSGTLNRMFGKNRSINVTGQAGLSLSVLPSDAGSLPDTGSENVVTEIKQLREDVGALAAAVSKLRIVLDSGALVGGIVEPLDNALGERAIYAGRGI